MSEPSPETAPSSGSSKNVFTRKLGALPLWAWMGIGLAVALGYYYWKQSTGSAAGAKNAASQSASQSPEAAGGVDSNLVPQFVNQTYVQNQPPAPTMPSSSPTPAAPAASTQADKYPAPTGTSAAKLTNTSAKINWNYITGTTPKPTSYTIALYQQNGKLAQQFTVNAPDTAGGTAQATVTGLHPGWQYNVQIWANGGKTAPPHSTAKLTLLWLSGLVSR